MSRGNIKILTKLKEQEYQKFFLNEADSQYRDENKNLFSTLMQNNQHIWFDPAERGSLPSPKTSCASAITHLSELKH
jgi:hypothetical protein